MATNKAQMKGMALQRSIPRLVRYGAPAAAISVAAGIDYQILSCGLARPSIIASALMAFAVAEIIIQRAMRRIAEHNLEIVGEKAEKLEKNVKKYLERINAKRFSEKYDVKRMLGEGGEGATFLAEDKLLGRMVVVKVPLIKIGAYSTDAVAKHLKDVWEEGKKIAKIKGPLFVNVFGVEQMDLDEYMKITGMDAAKLTPEVVEGIEKVVREIGGIPCIVMEKLEGREISKVIKNQDKDDKDKEKGFTTLQALRTLRSLLEAVSQMKAIGLVHKDLKPENVFLIGADKGEIKVFDFGIAKEPLEGNSTETRTTSGTLTNMAPEQRVECRGFLAKKWGIPAAEIQTTWKSDLFGAGGTFWEILSSKTPFTGKEDALAIVDGYKPPAVNDVILALRSKKDRLLSAINLPMGSKQDPKKLEELRRAWLAGMAGMLNKMLASNPNERYNDPKEGIAEVDGLIAEYERLIKALTPQNPVPPAAPAGAPRPVKK